MKKKPDPKTSSTAEHLERSAYLISENIRSLERDADTIRQLLAVLDGVDPHARIRPNAPTSTSKH